MLLRTPLAIEDVADRIERAYLRKHLRGTWSSPDPRLWDLAARALIEAHRSTPWLPLDPELFVACQPVDAHQPDPWVHLAPAAATRRYRRRVRLIVRGLRDELRREIRRAEAQLKRGESPEAILRMKTGSISALGRFLVAIRAGRPDLAERFRDDAEEQHAACPLYRAACRNLIPESSYPVVDLVPGISMTRRTGPIASVDCPN